MALAKGSNIRDTRAAPPDAGYPPSTSRGRTDITSALRSPHPLGEGEGPQGGARLLAAPPPMLSQDGEEVQYLDEQQTRQLLRLTQHRIVPRIHRLLVASFR